MATLFVLSIKKNNEIKKQAHSDILDVHIEDDCNKFAFQTQDNKKKRKKKRNPPNIEKIFFIMVVAVRKVEDIGRTSRNEGNVLFNDALNTFY